jgi:hypothetical protein
MSMMTNNLGMVVMVKALRHLVTPATLCLMLSKVVQMQPMRSKKGEMSHLV